VPGVRVEARGCELEALDLIPSQSLCAEQVRDAHPGIVHSNADPHAEQRNQRQCAG
jgi:hypothetical protein